MEYMTTPSTILTGRAPQQARDKVLALSILPRACEGSVFQSPKYPGGKEELFLYDPFGVLHIPVRRGYVEEFGTQTWSFSVSKRRGKHPQELAVLVGSSKLSRYC